MSKSACYDGLNAVLSKIEDPDAQQFMREALEELLPEEGIVANMSADVAERTIGKAITQAQAKVIKRKLTVAMQAERLTPMMDAVDPKDVPFMVLNTVEPQQAGWGSAKGTQAKGAFGDAIAPKVASADKLALNAMDEALDGITVVIEGKNVRAINALMENKEFGWAVAKIMNNAPDAANAAAPFGESAKFTAQAMTRLMDDYHTELLGRGILSGEVENYFPQVHSSYSVSHPSVGAEWREFMLTEMDPRFHGEVNEATVEYVARDILRGAPEDMLELGGPSELRLVHIKPESQIEYLERFSGKSAGQLLLDKMTRSEKRIAISQSLGPDYKTNFNWLISEAKKRLAGTEMTMAERKAAEKALSRAELVWKGTIGAYTGNVNLTAFTAATARLGFSAMKLGLTGRYIIQDAMFGGLRDATLHRQGVSGFFRTSGRIAKEFFFATKGDDLPRHLRVIREAEALNHMMTMERMIGDTLAGVDIGNVNLSGATPQELAQFVKAHDRMLKARKVNQTVLKYAMATRSTQASVETNVANTLKHVSRLATNSLDEVAKKERYFHDVMQAYGVDRHWKEIQGALDGMGNIDLDLIKTKDAKRAVMSMAYSEAEHIVGRPDMYTRSVVRKYGKAGTFGGELYLSATTFLATRGMIFNKVYANAARRGAIPAVAYAAGGLAAAAATVQLQQVMSGRPIYETWGDDGLNLEFAGRVIDESGVLFVLGPFLAGTGSGLQRGNMPDADKILGEQFGMIGSMVGDTIDMSNSVLSDYSKYGAVRDASYRRLLDTMKGYIPGQNVAPLALVINQAWLEVLDEVDPAYDSTRYRNYIKSGRNMEGISGKMAEGLFD